MLISKSPRRPLKDTADKNIIIVDDLPKLRDMIRVMLRNNGYNSLTIAGSGNQALRNVMAKPTDLVITDWQMPNMDGIELLMQMKNDPNLFHIPVIIMSEDRTENKVLYAIEEGADGFLIKPFNENDLLSNVRLALNKDEFKDERELKVVEMRRLKLTKKYREAVHLGFEILAKGPNQRVTMMMCDCHYQLEEYDKAITMITDTEEGGQSSEYSNLLGVCRT